MKFGKSLLMALAVVLMLSTSVFASEAPAPALEDEQYAPPGTAISVRPMTFEETALVGQQADKADFTLLSGNWSGTVYVPRNISGNQGTALGPAFIPSPHRYVQIIVYNLPSSMPTVNLSITSQINSGITWWQPNISGNSVITIDTGSYNNHSFVIRTSTNELTSTSASFAWGTY